MAETTHSHVHPPCPAPFNLAGHVLAQAEAFPDKLAVKVVGRADEEGLSFGALRAAVLGTATGLQQAGFAPGDRLLMRLGNTLDFPIAYLGALAAGMVPIPTSPALTAVEVAHIMAELAPRAVLRDPDVTSSTGAPEIGLYSLRALRALPPAEVHLDDPERLGYIVYTSGTSGVPRAVAHAHRAIWARQMMHAHWYGIGPDDVLLHAGAFNWTFTLGTGLMDPWTVGATALIPAPGTPVDALGGLLAKHRATLFAAAPAVFRQMLGRSALPALPHLRHGLSAGEKMAPRIHQDWYSATGTPVYEAYGLSECSTFVSSTPNAPAPTTTLGRPQPGRRVAILTGAGEAAPGTPGVIAVHRSDPGLMLGYVGAEEDTAARFRGDWFLTGDLGEMTPEGELIFLGRNDDMMNAGGYRVSPVEVEAALSQVPGLTSCGVAEVHLAAGKSIIVGFYTSPRPLDDALMRDTVAQSLARYKQPHAYVHLPTLPMSANGKLERRRLPQFWPKTRRPLS